MDEGATLPLEIIEVILDMALEELESADWTGEILCRLVMEERRLLL